MARMPSNQTKSPSLARKVGKIMMITLAIFVALILILVGALAAISPGKTPPYLDESGNPLAGSISEKQYLDINGVKQGMFIKSKNAANPVLLYLHGGMPDYFLDAKYPTGLDDYFTVVWWEQRGSGISYSPDIPLEAMKMENYIQDTLAMTNYLRERFDQDKIYLMGHSGGTFIGIQTAARAPELYHAYIGVAQMSYQLESEKIAYDYMLAEFRKNGDQAMARKLEAAPVTLEKDIPDAYRMVRDTAMHKLGVGTMHNMKSVVTGIFLPSLASREYTLNEKIATWTGKSKAGVSILWDEMSKIDLAKQVTKLEIPVYFFHGIYDYTVSYPLAKTYFDTIEAPVKGFYTFEQSAHSPMFEEPDRMREFILTDVLYGKNSLADTK